MRTKIVAECSVRSVLRLLITVGLLFVCLSITPPAAVSAETLPDDYASVVIIKAILKQLEKQPDSYSITLPLNGKEYKATLGELRKAYGSDSPSGKASGSNSPNIDRNVPKNTFESELTTSDSSISASRLKDLLNEISTGTNRGKNSVQVYINDVLIGSIDPDDLAPYKDVESAKIALIEEYLKRNKNINSKNMSVITVIRGSSNKNTVIANSSRRHLNPLTGDWVPDTSSTKIQIDGEWINVNSDTDMDTLLKEQYGDASSYIKERIKPVSGETRISNTDIMDIVRNTLNNRTSVQTLPNIKGQATFAYGENGVHIGALLQAGETDIPANMSSWAGGYIKTALLNGFGARFEDGGYSFTDYRQTLNKANLSYLLARALYGAKPDFDFSVVEKHDFDDAVRDNYSKTINVNDEACGVEEIVHSLDILKGVSETNFGGKMPVSRWQLAFSAAMTLSAAGNSVEPSSLAVLDKFTDLADLSEEVKKVLAFIVENNYMDGVGNTLFSPFSDATLEQGIRVAAKAFENMADVNKITQPIEITSHAEGALLSGNVLLTWRDPNRVNGAEIEKTGAGMDTQARGRDGRSLSGAREDFFRDARRDFFENRSVFTRNSATRYTVAVYSDGQSIFEDETTEMKLKIPADVINAGKRLQITVSSSGALPHSTINMAKTALLNCFTSNAYFNRAIRSGDKVTLYWRPLEGAARYETDITWKRTTGESVRDASKTIATKGAEASLTFDYAHNTSYSVSLRAYDAAGAQLPQTDSIPLFQGRTQRPSIAVIRYDTQKEMEANLKSVSVPVWRMDGKGNKTSSRANIQINKDIADVVLKIFEEIYNGPQKFPIKDVGGYSWRGDDSNSQHRYGLAIDINSNENYMPSRNVGSYWRPYDDPFSITPDGDVVKAFEKYGFMWGAGADSMHFAY